MNQRSILLSVIVFFCATGLFADPPPSAKEITAQDAAYKAVQLDNLIKGKKDALEREMARNFELFDKAYRAEGEKLNKLKKDEFETTNEFNTRIEAERVKLANGLQEKKDHYRRTVYDVEKESRIVELEKELEALAGRTYRLADSHFDVSVKQYNADGGYFDVTFRYYVRTDTDPATKKKTVVWQTIPLKWEIEREKAMAVSGRKSSLRLDCRASLFIIDGKYLIDNYEVSICDPDGGDALFNQTYVQNAKVRALLAAKNRNDNAVPVASVAASSVLTDNVEEYHYEPVRAFDGRNDTGWAEGVAGAGLGEWIEVRFNRPVAADRIMVSPGWFDRRYWALNNRIKRLRVELDDYRREITFQDSMTPQPVTLPGVKTFSRARFTILEVYPTGRDDDTCITGIEFWQGRTKTELNLDLFAERLKAAP